MKDTADHEDAGPEGVVRAGGSYDAAGADLATCLGRPAGSFPGLDRLSSAERKRLAMAIDAASCAHEQSLWNSLPALVRLLAGRTGT